MKALPTLLLSTALCGPVAAETLIIDDARLMDPTGASTNETVSLVIRDGVIADIRDDVSPDGAVRVIDARGRIVTPGLFNAATNLGLVEIGSARDTVDTRAGATGIGPDFDIQYALNPNSTLIAHARADGVTQAMSFPDESSEAPFMGHGAVIRMVDGADLLQIARAAWFARIGGDAERSRAGDWQRLRRLLSERDEDDETAPGREGPLAIVTHRESDIRQAVKLAEEFDLRLVIIGATEAWRVAELLAEHAVDVVLDPTNDLPLYFDRLGARLDNARRLQRAGVRVAFYSSGVHMNHNAGLALREAAGVAVANGMDAQAALAAITVSPAEIWAPDSKLGRLEIGARANLVIWDGDPLEPTSAAEHVLIEGRPMSLETRQKSLSERYHPRQQEPE